MNQKPATHPSCETLTAFVNGRLSDREFAEIENHVLNCEHCVEFLRTVPEDDLIQQVRTTDTSTMGGGTRLMDAEVDSASGDTNVESLSLEHLAELANHPRYRILRQLGAGGMGVVYEAEHRVMQRKVAIKVITPHLVSHPAAVERFHQEVKSAAKLSHKNIVTAYDAEQTGRLHYLVMEYVDGQSLDAIVKEKGPLSVRRACDYILQAALGLEHAFQQGMVHRDIKPQNLMCTKDGVVKILDFGLARLAVGNDDDTTGLTAFGTTVGTPDYIAPEQARDSRRVDTRADIYSLGGTLYYLLSGQTLFPEGAALEKVVAHMEREPTSIKEFREDVPEELITVLNRMLAKEPEDRFQTPKEVAAALKPLVKARQKSAEPNYVSIVTDDQSVRPRQPKSSKDSKIVWGSVAAVVICGLLLYPIIRNAFNGTGKSDPVTPAGEEGWTDLIASFDEQNVIAGEWAKTSNGLEVDDLSIAGLVLPVDVAAEYDLEIELTRRSGIHSVAVFFPYGRGNASFELDAWGQNLAGIQNVGGRSLLDDPSAVRLALEEGQRVTMLLEVRKDRVTAYVNGEKVGEYQGDGSDLSVVQEWGWTRNSVLGLGAYQSAFTFHRIRFRRIGASGD